jgi:hypothetical protein
MSNVGLKKHTTEHVTFIDLLRERKGGGMIIGQKYKRNETRSRRWGEKVITVINRGRGEESA